MSYKLTRLHFFLYMAVTNSVTGVLFRFCLNEIIFQFTTLSFSTYFSCTLVILIVFQKYFSTFENEVFYEVFLNCDVHSVYQIFSSRQESYLLKAEGSLQEKRTTDALS